MHSIEGLSALIYTSLWLNCASLLCAVSRIFAVKTTVDSSNVGLEIWTRWEFLQRTARTFTFEM